MGVNFITSEARDHLSKIDCELIESDLLNLKEEELCEISGDIDVVIAGCDHVDL